MHIVVTILLVVQYQSRRAGYWSLSAQAWVPESIARKQETIMGSLHAGELNKRIILQRQEKSRGPLGEIISGSIANVATVRAKAELKSNRKIRTLDQQQVAETWLFTLRTRPDVQIDWLIRWNDAVFTVVSVDRSHPDRVEIKAERDTRHDRVGD